MHGHEAGSPENIKRGCAQLGQDYAQIMQNAQALEIDEIYAANTQEAKSVDVFGAPSFTVGSDIFWGDDGLEDEISFSRLLRSFDAILWFI